MTKEMTFDEWLDLCIREKWCSETFCYTREVPPTTEEEDAEIEDGGEVCMFCTRLMELS